MKNIKLAIISISFLFIFGFYSCENWLEVEPKDRLTASQLYTSVEGVNSIMANIYAQLNTPQDFSEWYNDAPGLDLLRWDEAVSGSTRGENNLPVDYGPTYRSYWDYEIIRDINLIIEHLVVEGAALPENYQRYFKAEARFLRAFVYFELVKRMGGVPLITENIEYIQGADPSEFEMPRNKETEIYDFIASEIDEIKEDLNVPIGNTIVKNRASIGAALALKSRAMLYAGSIAKYSQGKTNVILSMSNDEIGIPLERAGEYFQKSLDASTELIGMDMYQLYSKNDNKAENFYEALTMKNENNPETIFAKDYDGNLVSNVFTRYNLPRSMRDDATGGGSYTNPTLNLVEAFERIDGSDRILKTKVGEETIDNLQEISSSADYIVYDNPLDIFENKDSRMFGTVIVPGSNFRGNAVELWAGLAIWDTINNEYDFKIVANINDLTGSDDSKIYYDGRQITGLDGPHNGRPAPGGVSRSGFLLRKYVDSEPGSGVGGNSKISYVYYRYGEILLNAAEASFELGNPLSESLGYINQVRQRAGLPDLSALTMEDIMQERRVELAFEDHRFNDAKRWRIADEIWNGDFGTPSAAMYALWPYQVYRPNHETDGKWIFRRASVVTKVQSLMFIPANYYAKIPSEAIGKNSMLKQNPN